MAQLPNVYRYVNIKQFEFSQHCLNEVQYVIKFYCKDWTITGINCNGRANRNRYTDNLLVLRICLK